MDSKHFKSGPINIIRSSNAALAGVTVALHFENLSRYHFEYQQQHFHQFTNPIPLVVSRDGHTHWVMDIQPYPIQLFWVIPNS